MSLETSVADPDPHFHSIRIKLSIRINNSNPDPIRQLFFPENYHQKVKEILVQEDLLLFKVFKMLV